MWFRAISLGWKNKSILLLVVITTFLNSGCSLFKPHSTPVSISCSEQDTILMINGQTAKCPTQMSLPRNRNYTVQAMKTGYMPYNRSIGHHLSTTGALDAVGTFLILLPGLGLLSPGAWDLDEEEIMINLVSMSKS